MIKKTLSRIYDSLTRFEPRAPAQISKHFSTFPSDRKKEMEDLIRVNLLDKIDSKHRLSKEGKADTETHVSGRLDHFRHYYIPWIDAIKPLSGATILEIGAGTGASTQALAEQGARVTAIDVDPKSLEIAKFRLTHCHQVAEFIECNANAVEKQFSGRKFDIVIFFAALEHMTTEERIVSLRQANSVLKPGGLLFVLEAPNRLWLYDFHTAFLPFYHWLPHELAALYARYSQRQLFRDGVNEHTTSTDLARWGRGVSYHEFELAGIPAEKLRAAEGLRTFHYAGKFLRNSLLRVSLNHKFKRLLLKMAPHHIAPCFFDPFLDVCIRK